MQIEADDQKWWQSNYPVLSGSIMFENILFIGVLEWLVILGGCETKIINETKQGNLKLNRSGYAYHNSKQLTLKSLGRKVDFCSLKIFSNNLFK